MTALVESFMVAGTRPQVGKTLVAAGLVRALARQGVHAVAMKPAATGAVGSDGLWRSDEVSRLAAANAFPIPARALCALRLTTEADGLHEVRRMPTLEDVVDCFKVLGTWADTVVVEDATCELVSIADARLGGPNLAAELKLPLVLVAPLEVGAGVAAAGVAREYQLRGVRMAGWIANASSRQTPAERERWMVQLRSVLDAPCLGLLPWFERPDTDLIADSILLDAALACLEARCYTPQ